MGRTIKEKHVKSSRRAKSSVKPSSSNVDYDTNLNDINVDIDNDNGVDELNSCTVPKSNDFGDYGWGYCTEEHLEELLLKQLEALYAEAVSRLASLGYDREVALKAVLRNGHCYGGMDVLANVLRNSMDYLKSGCDGNDDGDGSGDGDGDGDGDESELGFTELRQLEEYSLAGMVCLLQQVHPHFSRGDAMWCLLMSDLHLGRASTIDLSSVPKPGNMSGDGMGGSGVSVSTGLCRFHAGHLEGPVSHGNGIGGVSSCSEGSSKKFDLSPSMKSLLERNVAAFAAGFRAKQQLQNGDCSKTCVVPTNGVPNKTCQEFQGNANVAPNKTCQEFRGNNKEAVDSVLNKFRDLNLDGNLEGITEEQKEELVLTLLNQVKDLEKQVNERKDWAHQKAMQAARKLSNDMTELKILRMEREETQRLKRLKKVIEDNTMKRLSEMENALRKASGQVDCANAAVRQLEMENAEIRAEMEASKLSASESVTTCLEVSKREKKSLKKLLAWEKQKAKLQDEIAAGKQKFSSLQQQLVQINAAQKEAEAKWTQEVKEKELAIALVEEERRSKETTEVNNKRKLEALRSRIEIEFQRHKDDLLRLEQELSRLKATSQQLEPNNHSKTFSSGIPGKAKNQGQTIAKLLRELDEPEREGSERECMICLREEVSVVFLPCAHQVVCASCGEDYGKRPKATCPCCRVPIEQRIRVFGASS